MRALRIELRRGGAVAVLLVTAGLGLLVLFAYTDRWAGDWNGLAAVLRLSTAFTVPVTIIGGAWSGGRERRRRVGGLLASTPRPTEHRLVAQWVAMGLTGLIGYLVVFAVGAVWVAPVASYSGGEWPAILAVGALTVVGGAAVGILVGRQIRVNVAGPIVALLLLVVLAGVLVFAGSTQEGARWLTPTASLPLGRRAGVGLHAAVAGWYACLALACLILAAGTRRWWSAVLPIAGMVALTVPVSANATTVDDDALAMVCSTGTPRSCVTRTHAFLLAAVDAAARPIAQRVALVAGLPPLTQVQEIAATPGVKRGSAGTAMVDLSGVAAIDGELADPSGLRAAIAEAVLPSGSCTDTLKPGDLSIAQESVWSPLQLAVSGWIADAPLPGDDGGYRDLLVRLEPSRQGPWVSHYLDVLASCDESALNGLVKDLG